MVSRAIATFRRRKFFIKKGLQGGFVLGFSLAVFAGFAANMVVAYFLIDRELTEGLYKIHLRARSTAEIAGPVLWKLGAVTVPSILAVSAAVGYFLTRRVEVPLQDFRASVERIADGDFTRKIEEDMPDENLPNAFNAMTDSLASRFGSLKKSVERLDNTSAALERAVADERPRGELEDLARELASAGAEAGGELSRFRL